MSGTSPTPNANSSPTPASQATDGAPDFRYFSEIEECYQRARGTMTLLSPLDWALIESWKEAGVPLAAVRAGVERAFEKYKKRRPSFRKINSLAYCTQEVLRAVQEFEATERTAAAREGPRYRPDEIPFEPGKVKAYMASNLKALEQAEQASKARNQPGFAAELAEVGRALGAAEAAIAPPTAVDFQDLEARLTALEEKLTASFTRAVPAEALAEIQREIERGLASARRRMTIPQIESLSRQFLKRRLFEHYRVPRLSLFFM